MNIQNKEAVEDEEARSRILELEEKVSHLGYQVKALASILCSLIEMEQIGMGKLLELVAKRDMSQDADGLLLLVEQSMEAERGPSAEAEEILKAGGR